MRTLFLANPRGYCAGVVRAIQIVEKALNKWNEPIYVKHEIVHNRHVVDSLKAKGAVFIEDLDVVPLGSKLIYSAHGIPPQVREKAKERNLIEIDATCPLVTKIHSAVKRFAAKGYKIILIGHKNHQEIIGIKGEAPEAVTVIEREEDVHSLSFREGEPLFYVTQTTLSTDDVIGLSRALKEKYPYIRTLPSSSICYATINRQTALKMLLPKVNLVLVIGDVKSSNSNRLKEIGEKRGIKSFLVNHPEEITKELVEEKTSNIAMTAGASTPEVIVQECISKLKQDFQVDRVENFQYTLEKEFFDIPRFLYC